MIYGPNSFNLTNPVAHRAYSIGETEKIEQRKQNLEYGNYKQRNERWEEQN